MDDVAQVLLGATAFSVYTCLVQLAGLAHVSRRKYPPPASYPAISILKPMAGFDDDLVENLESHLDQDYPGELEMLIGVRDTQDSAYPVAKAFAEKHADRNVRLVLQEGEPGLNPKVNQLITLTRHAKHEIICVTDANVRVPRHYLREHAAVLCAPSVGLSTNAFAGVEERTVGAAIENLTHASFAAASIGTGEGLSANQIVGKSLVVAKSTLEKVGGWEDVKNLLAEDQRIGRRLAKLHIRTQCCPTFVQNVQRDRTIEQFWDRYSRWAMLRFLIVPGYWLEPMLIPTIWAMAFLLWHPSLLAIAVLFAAIGWNMAFTQLCLRIVRGHGAKLKYLLLVPVRDVLLFGTWLRGASLRTINWRGNALRVGRETALSRVEPAARPATVPAPSPAAVGPDRADAKAR